MIRAELAKSGLMLVVELHGGLYVTSFVLPRNDALMLVAQMTELLAQPEPRGEPVDDA